MKNEFGNNCGICYFGKPIGEFEGVPICRECLSHRIENCDEFLFEHKNKSFIPIPKFKSNGEWEWWQKEARKKAFEFFENFYQISK